MKASQLKPGQTVILDCGYGAHSDDQPCKILTVEYGKSIFGNPEVRLRVKMPNGTTFDTHGFNPESTVQIGA